MKIYVHGESFYQRKFFLFGVAGNTVDGNVDLFFLGLSLLKEDLRVRDNLLLLLTVERELLVVFEEEKERMDKGLLVFFAEEERRTR